MTLESSARFTNTAAAPRAQSCCCAIEESKQICWSSPQSCAFHVLLANSRIA
jgi:hypothetical protein